MKKLYVSHSVKSLATQFSKDISQMYSNPFAPLEILIPSGGLEHWLKSEMAEQNGVFCNFQYINYDDLLHKLYALSGQRLYASSSMQITLALFLLLDEDEFKHAFVDVSAYYAGNELYRIQLAQKISDLFDQYQVYRSDMLVEWERGEVLAENSADAQWQCWLWKRLVQNPDIVLKRDVRQHLVEALQTDDALRGSIREAVPRLVVFAQSVYPEFYGTILGIMSELTDVYHYLFLPTEPCDAYQSKLLKLWGNQFLELQETMVLDKDVIVLDSPKLGDTLLGTIQQQIIENSSQPKVPFEPDILSDGSMQVNSCFTSAREVECLYNYLLDAFQKDSTLTANDVLVVAPDMEEYAPLVEAVFQTGPVVIPHRMVGVESAVVQGLGSVVKSLLEFTENDFTAEGVMTLLGERRIQAKFEISDVRDLRSQLNQLNICFGWENHVANETVYVGWKYGVNRILLGTTLLTNEAYTLPDGLTLYPFQGAESSGAHNLIRLTYLVELLEGMIEVRKVDRTIAEWNDYVINQVLEPFIEIGYEDKELQKQFYRRLSVMERYSQQIEQPVSYVVYLELIRGMLGDASESLGFRNGLVTFTHAAMARAIPKRIIAFLGLDASQFPRKDRFSGFDMMGQNVLLGDRSRSATDKSLFLTTLLSASEAIYFSYKGRSIIDKSELPSSILLDDLLSYIEMYAAQRDGALNHLLLQQPLHGFSDIYHKGAPKGYFTYLYQDEEMVKIEMKDKEDREVEVIYLSDLISFFKSPIKWYYNKVLGIYLDRGPDDDSCKVVEKFGIDSLEQWQVKDYLMSLDEEIPEENVHELRLKLSKDGVLPLATYGELSFEPCVALTNLLKAEIKKIVEERNKTNYSVDISLEIEGKPIHLVGIIGNLYDDILIMPLFGKLKNKHRVNAKIQHLVLCADGMKAETHIVSASEDIDPLKFDTAAKEMILELCTIYIKECNELIPFWWVEEYLDVHENDYINRLVGDLTDEEAEMKDRITKLLS